MRRVVSIRYVCEICGASFGSKAEAGACESRGIVLPRFSCGDRFAMMSVLFGWYPVPDMKFTVTRRYFLARFARDGRKGLTGGLRDGLLSHSIHEYGTWFVDYAVEDSIGFMRIVSSVLVERFMREAAEQGRAASWDEFFSHPRVITGKSEDVTHLDRLRREISAVLQY